MNPGFILCLALGLTATVGSFSTLAAVDKPALRVVVKPSKTEVRVKEVFNVALRVENETKTNQTVRVMNCAWRSSWKTSNEEISWIDVNCYKNFEVAVEIPPGGAYTNQLEMLVPDPILRTTLSFRTGFTPMVGRPTIWSDEVKITVAPQSLGEILNIPFYAADEELDAKPLLQGIRGLPRVSAREAIALAQEFVHTNRIEVLGYRMSDAITLGRHPGGANHWDLRWCPTNDLSKAPCIDLRVEMDRTVTRVTGVQSTNVFHALFEHALTATGDRFVSLEQQLATNRLAVSVVKSNLDHPDPIGRLLARYILVWQETGGREFAEAMEYMDKKEERVRRTPAMFPRSDGVANTLSETYAGRATDFLATRLVKSSNWPEWKAAGVILYLEQQRIPSTTDALIRFAAETGSKELRKVAVDSIRQMRDAELPSKLRAEQARFWSRRQEEFPLELLELESTKKGDK